MRFFFPVTYKKMRLVARINSDQVSSKTDVTTSSYEGFKFCIDAHVNAKISVDERIQIHGSLLLHGSLLSSQFGSRCQRASGHLAEAKSQSQNNFKSKWQ